MSRISVVIALLTVLGSSQASTAGPVFGTLVIDFRLQWDPVAFDDGTFSDGTLYSPHMEYLDKANGSSMDIPIEHMAGELPSFSSPYQNYYTTPNFPLPVADNLPYGGVLSYYKVESTGIEGMIVGFAPDYTPVDDFDTLFNPSSEGSTFGISEADAIAIMKNPVPGTPQTPGYLFDFMVRLHPEIMPRWTYDALEDTYSLSMNLYAFSTPQLAGTSTSGATFTADTPVPVPAPSGLLIAVQGALFGLALRHFPRRIAA